MALTKGAGTVTDESVSRAREDACSKPQHPKKNIRPLTAITADIYKSGRQNIFTIGKLLREARDHFPHGKWIPYLKSIEWNERTAQLYISVADLADKYESVSHLNASPGALYELTSCTDREEEAAKWEEEAKREEASAGVRQRSVRKPKRHRKLAVAARKEAGEDTLLAIERLRASIARGDSVGQQRVAISLTRMAKINPPETTELALKAASDAINQNCFGDTKRYAAMMAQGKAIIEANPKTEKELKAVQAAHPVPFGSYANQDDIPVDVTEDEVDEDEDEKEIAPASAQVTGLPPRQLRWWISSTMPARGCWRWLPSHQRCSCTAI